MADSQNLQRQGRVAFTYPDFAYYQLARLFTVMATEMQSVAVGWQVYEITKRPLDLGYVGLAQFLPTILLFLVAGHAADRFNRRNIVTLCYAGLGLGLHHPAAADAERIALGACDLRGVGAGGSRAIVQRRGGTVDGSAAGARGTFSQCRGLGADSVQCGRDYWPRARRLDLCGFSRARRRIRQFDAWLLRFRWWQSAGYD